MRVAKAHAPHLVGEVTAAQQMQKNAPASGAGAGAGARAAQSGGESAEQMLQQARLLQQKGQHSAAIDRLLRTTRDSLSDHNQLEQVWETAVEIAMEHADHRVIEARPVLLLLSLYP